MNVFKAHTLLTRLERIKDQACLLRLGLRETVHIKYPDRSVEEYLKRHPTNISILKFQNG